MSLSRREFLDFIKSGKAERKYPTTGKVDWDAVYKELKKTKAPITIRIIHEEYVKGQVTRYRTKNKIQEWEAQGKCIMIWHQGMYQILFNWPKDLEVK